MTGNPVVFDPTKIGVPSSLRKSPRRAEGLGIKRGWQCPICGGVYAPWVSECRRCGPKAEGAAKPEKGLQSTTVYWQDEPDITGGVC